MLPLGDDNSDRRLTPFINWALIAVNILVFVVFQGLGENERFTYAFSTVPAEIVSGQDIVTRDETVSYGGQLYLVPGLQPTPFSVYITLLTSMFMHGGLAHIAGNLLFLWIFGDNIEDYLGHARYLIFYLTTGLLASIAHVASTYVLGQDPFIPSLGASGAISGVMGGYLLLFPQRRVTVLLFRFLTQVPAIVAVGMWFVFQVINGLGLLGGGGDGVAYAAHIGGFIAGLALVKFFALGLPPRQPRAFDPYRQAGGPYRYR
jgi:membrane associated rhomboid family serine protease